MADPKQTLARMIHAPTFARGFQAAKMGRFATERTGNVLDCTVRMRDRGKRCRFGVWERRSRLVMNNPGSVHPGAALRQAVAANSPLLLTGTINAYTARMAERVGHQAIYLSGGGLAANSLGMPDLGISMLEDVLIDVRRITAVTKLPLLVDADTGFGSSAFNIARCIRELDRAGAAGCHIEDQVSAKRCGHRPARRLSRRRKCAIASRPRWMPENTMSLSSWRAPMHWPVKAWPRPSTGRRPILKPVPTCCFPRPCASWGITNNCVKHVAVPILANITEFGHTPLFSQQELAAAGVDIVLYCCAAYRAMNKAAETVYQALLSDGHQRNVIDSMQTRDELYDYLDYHAYEQKLDELFAAGTNEAQE